MSMLQLSGIHSLPLWGRAGVGAGALHAECPHPNAPLEGEGEKS